MSQMTTDLPAFVRDIQPESTVLFFGSGSSLPSHAPRVADVIEHFSHIFNQPSDGFTLSELTDLIEQKTKDHCFGTSWSIVHLLAMS
jgi:hypothetical protein